MARMMKLAFCFLLLVGLWGCAGEPEPQALPEETTQEWRQATLPLRYPIEIQDEGPNWQVLTTENGGCDIAVYSHDGNEIFREQNWREPSFDLLGENLLRMRIGAGSNALVTVFFDLEHGIHSPDYHNLDTFGYGMVAYSGWYDWSDEENGRFLVVFAHDMFDPNLNYNLVELDLWRRDGNELPPEILEVTDMYFSGIRSIELLSATQLRVEYLNSNLEFTEEIFKLK